MGKAIHCVALIPLVFMLGIIVPPLAVLAGGAFLIRRICG